MFIEINPLKINLIPRQNFRLIRREKITLKINLYIHWKWTPYHHYQFMFIKINPLRASGMAWHAVACHRHGAPLVCRTVPNRTNPEVWSWDSRKQGNVYSIFFSGSFKNFKNKSQLRKDQDSPPHPLPTAYCLLPRPNERTRKLSDFSQLSKEGKISSPFTKNLKFSCA